MSNRNFTKWVACWGNATSITDRTAATYAKDITLRYPIPICFSGSKLRFHFSNLTGTEPVEITAAFVSICPEKNRLKGNSQELQSTNKKNIPTEISFSGKVSAIIPPGKEIQSDEIDFPVEAGDFINVSLYFGNFTQMNAGTLITGPLSQGKYSYGNHATARELPGELTRNTNWFYFLNTIDILTDKENHAIICYGDSITAQSWPDYLTLQMKEAGIRNLSVIRRAVSGTRILREYNCITYAAYGLKGSTRFPIEMNTAGASAVIIQHGINDIIHPVGKDVNPFRPWSDMPTAADLVQGVQEIYLAHARKLGLKVFSGTLLPISGWRTYNDNRDTIRNEFNHWLRTSDEFDGCIDFDRAVRDNCSPEKFAAGFDSGDHLHPSEKAYEAMARTALESLSRINF